MAFKLGSEKGNYAVNGNIQNKFSFKRNGDEDISVPGTPIIRKKLEKGIMGEANNDGSMFVSKEVKSGSHDEKHVVMHEMVHIKDMKLGRLAYNDDYIKWDGEVYERKNGMIDYKGQKLPEGDKSFPWEKMPWE